MTISLVQLARHSRCIEAIAYDAMENEEYLKEVKNIVELKYYLKEVTKLVLKAERKLPCRLPAK